MEAATTGGARWDQRSKWANRFYARGNVSGARYARASVCAQLRCLTLRLSYQLGEGVVTAGTHMCGSREGLPMFAPGSTIPCEARCGVPYTQDLALSEDGARGSQRMTGSRVEVKGCEHDYVERAITYGLLRPRAFTCDDLDVSSATTCVSLRGITSPTEERL